jgi:ATP-dependent DNA ligase
MATEIDSAVQPPFLPMEAKSVDALPTDPGWQFEPKWDGFRCLAVRDAGGIQLFAKSGKILGRYFPEAVANCAALSDQPFVLDGELVIMMPGGLSFEALQMRLHPAESRIKKLSAEIPAVFMAFDLPVAPDARDLRDAPLTERRDALETFLRTPHPGIALSPFTRERPDAQSWLDEAGGAVDGVVCKRIDGHYLAEERAMLKVKHIRTADCVIGGFRYATGSKLVGSLLLGLYNDAGKLDHVGFTSGFVGIDKKALTAQLEALRGEGFTGNAPGGPSRWSNERTETYEPLKLELVVEVTYDHVSGGRFRHGTRIVRWRPDKSPRQCTNEQIAPTAHAPAPIKRVLDGLSRGA